MVDRNLLWKAYPAGYLAMRGVKTVGGWECCERGIGEHGASLAFCSPAASVLPDLDCIDLATGSVSVALARSIVLDVGDLLPAVDPADPATWACCLHDLAMAAFGEASERIDFHRVDLPAASLRKMADRLAILDPGIPARIAERIETLDPWRLAIHKDGIAGEVLLSASKGSDPALALVQCRAFLRAKAAS